MANFVFNRGKRDLAQGDMRLHETTTDMRVLLVNATYTGATASTDHNVVASVTTWEISVGGYSRQPLVSETVVQDDTNDFAYFDADDVTFSSLVTGQTIGGAIVYKYNAADASADLLAFYDVTDTPTNGGNVTIQWATVANGGILKLA